MSRLRVLEASIVSRLSTATIGGPTAFATVEGASGGNRPALRAALRRERMPAAYVAFIDEPLAPEVREAVRGARFSVLIADRALRLPSDPRQGDATSKGTFALLQAARAKLDDYSPTEGFRLVALQERFVDADERSAVYELVYRVSPVDEVAPVSLTFDGDAIAGALSEMQIEVGSFTVVSDGDDPPKYVNSARPVVWRGEIRAASHAQLWEIEDNIEYLVAAQTIAEVSDVHTRDLDDCLIVRYERIGPRRIVGTQIVQPAAIHFSQLVPVP